MPVLKDFAFFSSLELHPSIVDAPTSTEHLRSDPRYSSPTWLYRYFGDDGALLYIGISHDFWNRDYHHTRRMDWRYDATIVGLEVFPTQHLAEIAEAIAIRNEEPARNVKKPSHTIACAQCDRSQWYLDKHGGELIGESPMSIEVKMPDFAEVAAQ